MTQGSRGFKLQKYRGKRSCASVPLRFYLDDEEADEATRRLLAASSNPLVEEFMPLVTNLWKVLYILKKWEFIPFVLNLRTVLSVLIRIGGVHATLTN